MSGRSVQVATSMPPRFSRRHAAPSGTSNRNCGHILHEPVGGFNPAVQFPFLGADALCFHLPDISALVDSRYQVKPLPHIGTVVDTQDVYKRQLRSR